MDKNTIYGMLLMGAIIFGFMALNKPNQTVTDEVQQAETEGFAPENQAVLDTVNAAERASIRATVVELGARDSVSGVTTLKSGNTTLNMSGESLSGNIDLGGESVNISNLLAGDPSAFTPERARQLTEALRADLRNAAKYRGFARYLSGDSTTVTLKNKFLTLELSNKGGAIARATLNNYEAFDSTKIELISPETDSYTFTLTSANQRFDTSEFYFQPQVVGDTCVVMSLDLGNGARFGIRYTLLPDSYLLAMDVIQEGMGSVIPSSVSQMDFAWTQKMRRNEAGRVFEERNSALYYMFIDGDVNHLSEAKDAAKELTERVKWIGYKNQFFSTIWMARENFTSAELDSRVIKEGDFIKEMSSTATLDYSSSKSIPASFVLYMGPNSYPMMHDVEKEVFKDENMHLTKVIPLGWSLFRWINTLIVIPVFSSLGSFISNYGIIILLLTLFIKIILFPFTYKSFISQARMRVLAPEIKEINDKYPGQENAMKRQQETMALYNRAGASPFSGCLPMLLQMPILIAMFSFFPSAIELRGQSFLWAKDLSAPDVIFTLPFSIPFYGDHVSLFCLLMTAVNIIYTKINMQSNPSNGSMPGMKWMMYLMPLMFLFFFNNYAAGLSYYYFLSLLITIVQTYIFRRVVDEDKVRAQMKANAKKPRKKSGFMARLEEAQRRQEAMMREQAKQKGRKR